MKNIEKKYYSNNEDENFNDKRIAVLDGARVAALFFVVWYHFWQQTWISPNMTPDSVFSKILGLDNASVDTLVKYGYDFVDALILLSAVCNFFPYAKSIIYGTEWPSVGAFYKKRAMRIFPSYYFSLIVVIIVQISSGAYGDKAFLIKDIFRRVTMTSIFFEDTFNASLLNGVLWTVQVEFWFYILIPWIALAFKKIPLIISAVMFLTSVVTVNYILNFVSNYDSSFYKDCPLSYCFLYVIGMYIVLGYTYFKKNCKENIYSKTLALIVLIISIYSLLELFSLYNGDNLAYIQIKYRIIRGVLFGIITFSLMFSFKWIKILFGNRIMYYLAAISYNMYIWHQIIAVWLKQWRIPYWEGETPPNILGDRVWMWKYNLLIITVSFVVAFLCTFFIEIPIRKWLKKKVRLQ